MMKTLCVAVVVLSLASVCQPASLACKQLLKPLDKSPDYSGRWHLIAMASNICVLPGLLTSIFMPSVVLNITTSDTPNIYNVLFQAKVYGYCDNDTQYLYGNNTIFDVTDNNAPSDKLFELIQSGCADCLVMLGGETLTILLLLSKRKTITAAEMKELETQVECLGWYKPELLGTDHEYENCLAPDEIPDSDTPEMMKKIANGLMKCISKDVNDYYQTIYNWIKEALVSP